MTKIALVGYGRFGKTLHRLIGDDFEVGIFHHTDSPEDICNFAQIIFYCVPIDSFERTIRQHKKYYNDHLLIDVLSVKEYPKKIFTKYLKNANSRSLLTHPMFGPDSSRDGFMELPIVMDKNTATNEEYSYWKTYFRNKGLRVIEISAREHDKLAANSQGLTHFIGRLLEHMKVKKTLIDTLGTRKLLEVEDQTCNDSWQLFKNLQNYNSFTKRMRLHLGAAYDSLYNSLLPKRVNKNHIIFGIQGGRGSFNEEALHDYVARHGIKKYSTKYLYTTEKVLKSLHEGGIDYGLFAIHNAVGGVVTESTHAMARYLFQIVEEFPILIRHCLMKRKDVKFEECKEIMAHPQVFLQCKTSLKDKYPAYIQKSGKGDLIDHAKAAQELAKGRIPRNTLILGPKILSKIYSLEVINENMQDINNNLTSFFMVSR